MAEVEAEWELCKENIQPLRRGRDISALREALSMQQEGSSSITQRQQGFESELRMYDGDDPLDVWDRYIKWTEQTFPQGGKESNYSVLLERAVMKFTEEKKYYNDVRYIDLWVKFANGCPEPLDMYRYMHAQGIGLMSAMFYIAWSEEYEKRGNFRGADSAFQNGLKIGAEPRDRLKQFHRALQARVTRHVLSGAGQAESDDDTIGSEEPNRKTLVELKATGESKVVAPISRGSSITHHQPRGLQMKGPKAPVRNSRLVVFNENKGVAEPLDPKLESWMAPPSARPKENEQKADKWTKAKLPKKTRAGLPVVAPAPTKPTFQPFVEECDQTPAVTPCKINPSVNSVLSARKPHREDTPLKRLQEWQAHQQQQHAGTEAQGTDGKPREKFMYCKEVLFNGATEFCFEELRAERYFKKMPERLAANANPSGDSVGASALSSGACAELPPSVGTSAEDCCQSL